MYSKLNLLQHKQSTSRVFENKAMQYAVCAMFYLIIIN